MMRHLLRPLWLLLALIILIEEWLWERLAPLVRAFVDLLASWSIRQRLAAIIEHLSPPAALVVFAVPFAIYHAMELLALWPLAHGRWIMALAIIIFAKVAGAAMTAFAFDLTRHKLMEMAWFRVCYDKVVRWLALAHSLADPYLAQLRAAIKRLRLWAQPMLRSLRRRARQTR